ncbi:MAG: hypothetical protein R2874_09870 [Desulfobacterales bacterium]
MRPGHLHRRPGRALSGSDPKLAGIPDAKRLMIAVALGYPEPDFPANQVESTREPVDNITTLDRILMNTENRHNRRKRSDI